MRADHFAVAAELTDGRKGQVAARSSGRCPGSAVPAPAVVNAPGCPRGSGAADKGSGEGGARGSVRARPSIGARIAGDARATESTAHAAYGRTADCGSARTDDIARRSDRVTRGRAPGRQPLGPAAASSEQPTAQKDETRNHREERDSSHTPARARSIPSSNALIPLDRRSFHCATLGQPRPTRQRLRSKARPRANLRDMVGECMQWARLPA